MSVIISEATDWWTTSYPDSKCCVCQGRLGFPRLDWKGSSLKICGRCCVKIKRGFIADLIHVAAIVELNDAGYPGQTLVRKSTREVEAEAERDERAEAAALRETRRTRTIAALKKNVDPKVAD